MTVDLSHYSEILKLTGWAFTKLFIMSYFVFYKLPQYLFPQDHIEDVYDRIIFNSLYMITTVITISAFLFVLRIFSFITLITSFFFLKAGLMYYFEKRNFFKEIYNYYFRFMIKFYDILDDFYVFRKFGRKYKDYKSLIYIENFSIIKLIRITLVIFSIGYIIYSINFLNFISISDKASDTPVYIEWLAFLHRGILYPEHFTSGAYFFGTPIIIYFFQLITNIDSTIISSVYPVMFFLYLLLGIYYLMYKTTGSHFCALVTIILFGLYCISPLDKYILGYEYFTENPPILNILGFKIYFAMYPQISKYYLISDAYIPYMRLNAGLPYELAFTFFPLYLYFFITYITKKKNIYLLLYAITLYLILTFHGATAIFPFLASIFILINAIFLKKIDWNTFKKGILVTIIVIILGNLWALSILKYGMPRGVGAAAPFIDKLLKTQVGKQRIVSFGAEAVSIVVFYKIQLLIFGLMLLLYPLTLFFRRNKKFFLSSLALAIWAVMFIYIEENLGLPAFVSKSRTAEFLLLSISIGLGTYFHMIETLLIKFFYKLSRWIILGFTISLIIIAIFIVPRWENTRVFYENINASQYNATMLAIYKIRKLRRPYTWTVVGSPLLYPKVLDKGFHINNFEFLKKYNPSDKYLRIPSEYIYIFVQNLPSSYKGSGEWFYIWKKDINLQLLTWIQIYSKYHQNIRIFLESPSLIVYEINNKEYLDYLYKKSLEGNK